MSAVVIDSNFLVALVDPKDVWHKRASEIEAALDERALRVFLDIVIGESLSVIARRCEEKSDHQILPASFPPCGLQFQPQECSGQHRSSEAFTVKF